SREGELRLGLDARGREGASAEGACAAARAVQQCRLPDPGFPANHQRSAAVANAVQEGVDPRDLVVAPDQLAGRIRRARDGHMPRISGSSHMTEATGTHRAYGGFVAIGHETYTARRQTVEVPGV